MEASTLSLEQGNATPYSSLSGTLGPKLVNALAEMKYEYMTPVQQKVFKELPTLRTDCVVQAKTGTGKTTAFLLPALQCLTTSHQVPKGQVGVLIISPTRELAMQIAKECDQLTKYLRPAVECHTAYGGEL